MNGADSKHEIDQNLAHQSNEFDGDDQLVAALRRKEPAAFETLIRRFGGRMNSVARRYLKNEQDCNDAVQDAFISVFQSIDRYQGNSELGTWLHRIAVNACLMKLRQRSRRPAVSIEELLPKFDAWGHDRQPARRWKVFADDVLQRDENRELIRRCIDQLPDDYREVVLLRDIEEFSTDETAAMLQITPGSVKTRLHRARQALRTLLEPHFAR